MMIFRDGQTIQTGYYVKEVDDKRQFFIGYFERLNKKEAKNTYFFFPACFISLKYKRNVRRFFENTFYSITIIITLNYLVWDKESKLDIMQQLYLMEGNIGLNFF